MGGPPSNAKYYLTTDSEAVRRLKVDKHPDKGSERVPEIVRLQAVGALRGDGVLFVERSSELIACASLSHLAEA